MEHSLGTILPLFSAIPFVGMLLSIALGPVIIPNIWHHHFGKISAGWAALMAIPLVIFYQGEGIYEILHVLIADYIPFIVLLGALFTVGGGILVRTSLKGTTAVNAGFLMIGSLLASWMGTTGAASLLIRPFLRVNKHRKYKAFMVVFFIFMVANVGGSLTPLGDPPLFLGFLHGVPFFWTLRLIGPMMVVLISLLVLYIIFDKFYLRKEAKEKTGSQSPLSCEDDCAVLPSNGKKIQILGTQNFILLATIIGIIIFSGSVKMSEVNILGVHRGIQDIIRDLVLVAIIFISMKITPKALRTENEYSLGPHIGSSLSFLRHFYHHGSRARDIKGRRGRCPRFHHRCCKRAGAIFLDYGIPVQFPG